MARKKDAPAPLAERIAQQLQREHARGLGGVHAGFEAGGCTTCALLREARAAKLLGGPWPTVIAWDGTERNR